MSSLYTSGEYAAKNPSWHQEHSDWKAAQVRRMLAKHELKPKRIAEVGCGAGGILEALRAKLDPPPDCTGYEISPQALNLAKPREEPGLPFVLGSTDPAGGPYELVLAMDVLEHVEDYLGFVRSLKQIARWQILHIPLDLSIVSLMKPAILQMARKHVGHLHYFCLETALASVEQADLQVRDFFLTSVELDEGGPGKRRLDLIRRCLRRCNERLAARWLGGFSVLLLTE